MLASRSTTYDNVCKRIKRKQDKEQNVMMHTVQQRGITVERFLVSDLLYFSEERIGALDLPLAQLSQGHFLEVDLKTKQER